MARRAAGLGLNLIAYDPYASEEKARAQVSASGFSCRMHRILLDHWRVLLSCVPIWCKAIARLCRETLERSALHNKNLRIDTDLTDCILRCVAERAAAVAGRVPDAG